jgi:RNA polymerase sigma-70 factor (ECF subfamily)
LNRCIALLIADLPEKYSDILVRSELQEEKQQAIADKYQLSLVAVMSRIIRGRSQLKKRSQACCDFEFNEFGPQASCKSHCGCEK